MMWFTYSISHVPRKALYTTDALSCAPTVRPLNQEEEKLAHDVKAYVDSVIKYLPGTEDQLAALRWQQQQDEVTNQLHAYWSSKPTQNLLARKGRLDNRARLIGER